MKWLRRLGYAVLVLAVLAAGAYYWLFIESGMPVEGSYAIDMAEVRRLAASQPGEGPSEIRVETLGTLVLPGIGVVAGDGWDNVDMPVSSFQLVYADRTGIVDAGFDPVLAREAGGDRLKHYDDASWGRVSAALAQASFIVITHEHMDHIGGLAAHPDQARVLAAAILPPEQLADPSRMAPAKFPEDALKSVRPFAYEKYAAVAPGVVLIRAAGHTPGSQIVYVRTASGQEYLFLGDVAWHRRNVDLVRERARIITSFIIREDRDAVMLQLAELKRLSESEPKIAIMPGHDQPSLDRFLREGLLVQGFR